MRKLIIIFGLLFAYNQADGFLDSLKYPAEGLVSEINVRIVETPPESTGTSTGTVTGTGTTTTEPTQAEPVEEVFEPLDYNGKVGSFIKKHGGKSIKIKDHRRWSKITLYPEIDGYKSKGVEINGDFYFTTKKGVNYVIHKGKLIKL